MARVTAEDCVIKVPNRFELVMLAAQRARNISAGAPLTIEKDNDKNPVISLREIADETIDLSEIENALIQSLQKHVEMDEPEEDEMDFAAIQKNVDGETGETTTKEAEGDGAEKDSDAPEKASLETAENVTGDDPATEES